MAGRRHLIALSSALVEEYFSRIASTVSCGTGCSAAMASARLRIVKVRLVEARVTVGAKATSNWTGMVTTALGLADRTVSEILGVGILHCVPHSDIGDR